MRRALAWLGEQWLLAVCVVLAAVLAVVDPRGGGSYGRWLQLPTVASLLGLLIAIGGIRDSGLVQRAATMLVRRVHSQRRLGLLLVGSAALLSMALTNDVSLFLLVPITVAIGSDSALPVLRLVILEALAVNAGSTLSPIGNPQNLLLWQHSGLSFAAFVWHMLPAAAAMLALLGALTVLLLPVKSVAQEGHAHAPDPVRWRFAIGSMLGLAGMIVLIEFHLAAAGAGLLLLAFLLLARASLARLDWALLLTFAALFVAVGHLGELPWVQHALGRLDLTRPLTVFLAGVLGSQVISNVPATVLLLHRVHDPIALATAVDVGGFGVVIGSLANLIALRLADRSGGLWRFHLIAVPFLLVCAPLVYLVQLWLR